MPTCDYCKTKWTYKETLKMLFSFKAEMICPHCGERQYQSKKSQAIAPFTGLIVFLPLLLSIFIDIPVFLSLLLIPILAIGVLLSFPFFTRLSSKEEYYLNDYHRK